MDQICPHLPPNTPPRRLRDRHEKGGGLIKVRGSDDCCKSVLSAVVTHMNSQHPQIHAQDKAIQNPSMHEEGS